MAKITINDKDYYTDDFNEEQMKIYAEIQMATNELERMSYMARVLDTRREQLAGAIVQLAEAPQEEQLELPLEEANG